MARAKKAENREIYPDLEKFEADPCRFIEEAIKEYAHTSPINRLTAYNSELIYEEPLVGFACGDDRIFQDYKKIIGEFHYTPREILSKYITGKAWHYGVRNSQDVSVISWAMPIPKAARLAESESKYGGSRRYNYTRWVGAKFHENLANYVTSLLEIMGLNAVSPSFSKFTGTTEMPGGWRAAHWSERHIAYACGMGTLGLNGLMITRKGCAVYLGSAVCHIALSATQRNPNRVGNCLYYRDGSCRRCIERCPGGAISGEGRNNLKCRDNLVKTQFEKLKELGLDRDLVGMAPSCGLCSNGVPCEDRIPE